MRRAAIEGRPSHERTSARRSYDGTPTHDGMPVAARNGRPLSTEISPGRAEQRYPDAMTAAARTDSAAEDRPGNRTRAGNVPALERATGRPWHEWLRIFEAAGASGLGHAGIADVARAAMPAELQNPDWWAQGAAIAYEQHAGLRVPGQSSSGGFRVGASRTLPLDRDAAIEAWDAAHGDRAEHLGHAAGEPRRSRTDKRSFLRFDLDGAGRVEVAATPKGEKTSLAVSHDGLADGERIEEWRAHWKSLLAEL
ncbi:hypothetical protein H490_0105210 [Leucobacter sp. UCD-THU]|nr:hypothetical protein H490_0105210 [Leucobacter sp. UCD-THU]